MNLAKHWTFSFKIFDKKEFLVGLIELIFLLLVDGVSKYKTFLKIIFFVFEVAISKTGVTEIVVAHRII